MYNKTDFAIVFYTSFLKFLIHLNIWQLISLEFLMRGLYYLFLFIIYIFYFVFLCMAVYWLCNPVQAWTVELVPYLCGLLWTLLGMCLTFHTYMFSVDFTTWKFHSNVKFANSYYHEVVLNFYLRFFFLYFHTCSNALSSLSINIVNSNSLCWQNHFRGDTTILLGDT